MGSRIEVDWSSQPLGQVPDSEIARRIGCSRSLVAAKRAKLGVPKAPRLRTPRRCVLVPLRLDAYAGVVAAAATYGVSPTRFARVAIETAAEAHMPVAEDDPTETPLPSDTAAP